MNKITVLYICIDSTMGGSTASLYNLIDSVKKEIYPIVLFPEEGVGYDFFVRHGIECHVYPFVKLHVYRANRLRNIWKRPWRWHYINKMLLDYGCYKFVKRFLSGRRLDIIHSNTSPNDIGAYLSKRLHVKHVWHVREFCDLHFNFNIYRGIPRLKKLICHADARIAISSAIKEHWNLPNKNTWVINDAVRKESDVCFIPNKQRYLLFCSYFITEAKGARIAINAFGESGICTEGYRLKLVGNCDDEFRKSLLDSAQKLGCEEYVDFIPCQSEMKALYSEAGAFIMASKHEGLGRITAEAMFYGCPVIAHASGGTLELIKHGETGWLFNSEKECAMLIRKVCHESQEQIIMKAQQFVLNNLTQEKYGPKIIEVYNHVLKGI